MVTIFAHRGASGHAPDNSIRGFELAVEMGTRDIETDVKATRDGQLVFFHDFSIGKFPRVRPVLSLDVEGLKRRALRQSRTKVPTVIETFAHFRRSGILKTMTWSIDVPAHFVQKRLVHIARAFSIEDRIIYCNEKATTLASWAARGIPPGQLAWSIRDKQIAKLGPEGIIHACRRSGIGIVNVKEEWLSRQIAATIHDNGLNLFIWDCHDERRLRRALRFNPSAIYTNFPDMTVAFIHGRPTATPRPRDGKVINPPDTCHRYDKL